jgi:hypothetical protein
MRPGCRIVTNTNGTVMTPEQIRAIATESLLDQAVFSIDGATAESDIRLTSGRSGNVRNFATSGDVEGLSR